MGIISQIHISLDLSNRKEIIRLFERGKLGVPKVCEIGPGTRPLILEYPGNAEYFGIEYPGLARETLNVFNSMNKNIKIRECDISTEKWPFEDNTFDVFVSNQVLEHIPNTDHFLEEFYRILKPGGYGIISTPNLSSLLNIIQLILTFQPIMCFASDRFYGIGNPLTSHHYERRDAPFHGHLRVFSLRALIDLCKVYRFKVERKTGGGLIGIPLFDRFIARLIPWYGYYATIKVRKI